MIASMAKMLASFGETLEPYLSEIVPKLLDNIGSKNEKVQKESEALFDQFFDRYSGNRILDIFLETLDIRRGIEHVTQMQLTLKVLNHFIDRDGRFVRDSNHKRTMKRLSVLIYDFPDDMSLVRPCLEALQSIYELEPEKSKKFLLNLPYL